MYYSTDPEAIREAIELRDQNQCMNCGKGSGEAKLDVHHIVPRGQGGSDQMSNLVLLCRRCHEAAHGNRMAPTVEFQSTGGMQKGEFELYRRFFNKVPQARYDEENKVWRVPKADMEWLVESVGERLYKEKERVEDT